MEKSKVVSVYSYNGMKFQVIQDKSTNLCCWALVTNAGDMIATSSTAYLTPEEVESAIKDFKNWVRTAPLEHVTREAPKDWKQQAKDQLRKPWTKA